MDHLSFLLVLLASTQTAFEGLRNPLRHESQRTKAAPCCPLSTVHPEHKLQTLRDVAKQGVTKNRPRWSHDGDRV